MNYGYLWYKPFDAGEVYAAIGDSGNIIYVNKEVFPPKEKLRLPGQTF